MIESPENRKTLTSWKEVAAYFGTTTRTVMRWEQERGLPIRRFPGEARSRVYAEIDDLRAWMQSAGAPGADPAPRLENAASTGDASAATAPPLKRARLYLPLAAIALAALAVFIVTRRSDPPLSAEAKSAYDTANQNFDRRTPVSLAAAIDGFQRVVALAPQSSEGFAGLASVYAIMPEYTAMRTSEGFAKAETFAREAIARDARDARAQAVYAFARYYGALDKETARKSFARAVALDPGNVQARHWYATFLLAVGEPQKALKEIDRALALDPASDAIAADRACILAHVGRADEARALLEAMIARKPTFRSPHAYLAEIAFDAGDDATFVKASAERARLQNDLYGAALAEAARAGLAKGGRVGMLKAMLAARLRQFQSGVGSAVEIARLYGALGDKASAKRWLDLGLQRHEPEAAYIDVSPLLRALRDRGES